MDVWIAFVTTLFTDNEFRSGYPQNLYADHYSKILLEIIYQALGAIRCTLQTWEPGELSNVEEHGTIEERKGLVLFHKWLEELSESSIYHAYYCTFIALINDCFDPFVCSEPPTWHSFYIAEIFKSFKEIILIGRNARLTELESDKYLEGPDVLRYFKAYDLRNRPVKETFLVSTEKAFILVK